MGKNLLRGLAADLLASVFLALSINTFTVCADFAPGGVSGLAVILNYLFGTPVGMASIAINIPIILLTFRRLGTRFFLLSAKTMVVSSVFIDLTAPWMPVFHGNRLLSCVLAGSLMGVACGIVFSQGSSFGSSDFVTFAVKKAKPNLSVGQIAQVVNGAVILLAAVVFRRMDAVALGLVHTVLDCAVLDAVMHLVKIWRKTTDDSDGG